MPLPAIGEGGQVFFAIGQRDQSLIVNERDQVFIAIGERDQGLTAINEGDQGLYSRL